MSINREDITQIQACLQNTLDLHAIGNKRIVGIIGDAPSHYAKSPPIWNAVFGRLNMDAVYLPFDVEESRLSDLVNALRNSGLVMGANVTVPYKIKIIEYLDGLDKKAAQIKAVNTVVRTEDGRLLGYNTDGSGFLESILTARPGQNRPFIESLKGIDVLIIGAGGAARAVAFYLAEKLESGTLYICNRTPETALSLAEEISKASGNARSIKEDEITEWAPKAGLIINCSTKGQAGIRRIPDGRITVLEAYSALAPANPATFPNSEYANPALYRNWLTNSLPDIEANNRVSLRLALSIPDNTAFCDLIYFPLETVFLRHGRLSGHRTLNGKGMNVAQAVDAFFDKVCRRYLQICGKHNSETYGRVIEVMWEAW
ncbi:MAG: shikimate dehydrogenase family protein [Candidatus Binatia bacterium]